MNKETYLKRVQIHNEHHQKQLYKLAKRFINPINVGDIVSCHLYRDRLRSIRVESMARPETLEWWFDTVILTGTVVNKDGTPAKNQSGNRMSSDIVEFINGKPLKEPRVKSWGTLEYEVDPTMYE